jgi:hypothetical protein
MTENTEILFMNASTTVTVAEETDFLVSLFFGDKIENTDFSPDVISILSGDFRFFRPINSNMLLVEEGETLESEATDKAMNWLCETLPNHLSLLHQQFDLMLGETGNPKFTRRIKDVIQIENFADQLLENTEQLMAFYELVINRAEL